MVLRMTTLTARTPTYRDELAACEPTLRRRALALTKNQVQADDLVQDTVERALRFAHTYRPGSNLAAWLTRVMHNVFMSRCRRRQVEVRVLRHLAFVEDDVRAMDQTWFSPAVENALGELPEKLGDVVRLVDLDELSYAEAAQHLSVPLGTVMSRLHRGRKRLAARLVDAETMASTSSQATETPRAA
jgi:RNA polymerase sigma-70 factor (ECF subfamily)